MLLPPTKIPHALAAFAFLGELGIAGWAIIASTACAAGTPDKVGVNDWVAVDWQEASRTGGTKEATVGELPASRPRDALVPIALGP
jgi:hypothetical protein